MITERTLRKWRGESLKLKDAADKGHAIVTIGAKEINERILRLTQELLDQHLLRKEIK